MDYGDFDNVWTADFETCDDRADHGGSPERVRVWLWAVCSIGDYRIETGDCIDTFMAWLMTHDGATVWFHNLAYDGTHIIDFLMRAGIGHQVLTGRKRKPDEGRFTTLISSSGKFYSIKINFPGCIDVEIRDSLKKFPMSVAAISKQFGMHETKGEIDYRMWRGEGYQATEEELSYIYNDVQITARAMREDYLQGLKGLTIGADCMSFYRDNVGRNWKIWFPKLNCIQDSQMRCAYRGGYTYLNPEYAGKDVHYGISVDYNSMYPSMMLIKEFPYGYPSYFRGKYELDEDMPLYIQTLTCTFHVKPDGFPMVQVKNSPYFGTHVYVRDADEPVTLSLSSVDLQLFFDNYDVEVWSYDGGYKFKAVRGMFDDYIRYWSEIKTHSVGGQRQIAKLFLNNLYGKFGTNPDVTGKIPEMQDGLLHLVLGEKSERPPVYVPVAIFATAWARDTLIRACMAHRDRFIYCDTDSMHLTGFEPPAGIELDDTALGKWKLEGRFRYARHLRAKTYIWDLNGKWDVKCAGMPRNIKAYCDFSNFYIGFRNYDMVDCHPVVREGMGKLLPKMVHGGRTLVDGLFEIK